MDVKSKNQLDFSTRFRRSEGRSGRTFAATAKVTESELGELDRVARSEQKALSEWSREVLLREARRSPRDPLFTEITAIRMLLNYVLKPIACGERMTEANFNAALAMVRAEKHENALELMQQYRVSGQKENQ